MAKNVGHEIVDVVSDIADMFGLGDFTDSLLTGSFGKKEPSEVYADIMREVNNNIDKIQNLNNQELNRLNSALNSLYTTAPSVAFKDKINNIISKTQQRITNLTNQNSNLETVRSNAANNANRVLNERKSGANAIANDIKKQNQQMIDAVNNIERKV